MKVVSHIITLFFGMMLAAIWILGNTPDCVPPADVCVPLYESGIERWTPGPSCPAPEGEK